MRSMNAADPTQIRPQSAKNNLIADMQSRPLVLFVGAGVNLPSVKSYRNKSVEPLAPAWETLLSVLLKKALHTEPVNNSVAIREIVKSPEQLIELKSSFDSYAQASILKSLLGRSYVSLVQKEIYSRYSAFLDWNKSRPAGADDITTGAGGAPYHVMHELSKLCCCTKIGGVVTYNYDCFLSHSANYHTKKNQRKFVDVYNGNQISGNTTAGITMPVYHVHGYLPPPAQIHRLCDPGIVMSLDEYFSNMVEPFSWQTSTQLYFLTNCTSLFVGTSLDDVNMRRLISYARMTAPGLRCYTAVLKQKDGTPVQRLRADFRNRLFREIGIIPVECGTPMDIALLLKELRLILGESDGKCC